MNDRYECRKQCVRLTVVVGGVLEGWARKVNVGEVWE